MVSLEGCAKLEKPNCSVHVLAEAAMKERKRWGESAVGAKFLEPVWKNMAGKPQSLINKS